VSYTLVWTVQQVRPGSRPFENLDVPWDGKVSRPGPDSASGGASTRLLVYLINIIIVIPKASPQIPIDIYNCRVQL
jgi:hypothetical protein